MSDSGTVNSFIDRFNALVYLYSYNLIVSIIQKALLKALKGLIKRPLTEALLFDSYAKVAATLDEVVFAGIVENLNEDIIRRGTKLKLSSD